MNDVISVSGLVATHPRFLITSEGVAVASFRIASPQRRFNRFDKSWSDAETNWYMVSAFGVLAENIRESVDKGDRIVVRGSLRLRKWERDGAANITVEIEADSIGHDLKYGVSDFTRSMSGAEIAEAEQNN